MKLSANLPSEAKSIEDLISSHDFFLPEYIIGKEQNTPDPITSRGKIYLAADKLFAEHGYYCTSTNAIAKIAGVTLLMLHLYYGSKLNLYKLILRRECRSMLIGILNSYPVYKSHSDMLADLPNRLAILLNENPHWAPIIKHEIAEGSIQIKKILKDFSQPPSFEAVLDYHSLYRNTERFSMDNKRQRCPVLEASWH